MAPFNIDEFLNQTGSGLSSIPDPPAPTPAPAPPSPKPAGATPTPTATSTSQCPPDQRWSPTLQQCVPRDGSTGHIPKPDNHPAPGPAPAPTPNAGACPDSTPNGPAPCCPSGTVWRKDTKQCEAPDARSKADQDTCPPVPGSKFHGGAPGPGWWCDFDDMTWKQGYAGPGSGAGAGGGGKGGGAPRSSGGPPIAFGSGSTGLGATLEEIIRGVLNSPSRYTPQALQSLYGEIARQSSGQIQRGERAVRADAARRGMSRSGRTDALLRGVRDTAEQQRGSATVGVQTAKLTADFQDKMAGLDRAQKYLDALRDHEYRYMLAAEQRRQFDANLALGYANLAQQRSMLQMQLQSNWDMLTSQQSFLLLQGSV